MPRNRRFKAKKFFSDRLAGGDNLNRKNLFGLTLAEMEALWQEAKALEGAV